MTGADLSGANLIRAKVDQFTLFSLSRANLEGALIDEELKREIEAIG
jgi:uncharacterized protein YjbI with pentapeptide repeats